MFEGEQRELKKETQTLSVDHKKTEVLQKVLREQMKLFKDKRKQDEAQNIKG